MAMTYEGSLDLIELDRCVFSVTRHSPEARLLVITRLPAPYGDTTDIELHFRRLTSATVTVPRHRTALLIDSRFAPARNDPAFEEVFARCRQEFMRGFRRLAGLMRTSAGMLQASRHVRMDGIEMGLFTDPCEALAYLRAPLTPAQLDVAAAPRA